MRQTGCLARLAGSPPSAVTRLRGLAARRLLLAARRLLLHSLPLLPLQLVVWLGWLGWLVGRRLSVAQHGGQVQVHGARDDHLDEGIEDLRVGGHTTRTRWIETRAHT